MTMRSMRLSGPGGTVLSGLFCMAALVAAASGAWMLAPRAARGETVPPGTWVYDALRMFELRGLVRLEPTLPYSRERVEAYAIEIRDSLARRSVPLGARERFYVERLEKEFIGTAARPEDRREPPPLVLRDGDAFAAFDAAAGASFIKKADEEEGEVDGIAIPRFLVGIADGVTAEATYRLRMAPERGANAPLGKPSPRTKSFRGLTAEYERAILHISRLSWEVRLGRDYIHWGNRLDDGLLLSRTAGSLDQISARLTVGRLSIVTAQAILDAGRPRRLAGHRLTVALPRGVFVGVGETVIYTGRDLDFAYLLPLGIFYANQYNEAEDDNILWSIDAKAPLGGGFMLSGELLVDDFQYERGDDAPDRLAASVTAEGLFLAGGREIGIEAGYTYADIYTYAHKDSLLTRYLAGGGTPGVDPILGTPIGPDADMIYCKLSFSYHERATASLRISRTRRGEGNDLREWVRGTDPHLPFPSGEVDRERVVELANWIDFGKGSYISAGGGFRSLEGGSRGGETTDGFATLEVVFDF